MPRRAIGEGTIFRRKDGRWQGQLTVGYKANGQRQRKTVYGHTQREVREKLESLKRNPLAANVDVEGVLVSDYLRLWQQEKSRNWKPRTAELYKHNIDRHITPRIGRVQLGKLTPRHVQQLVGEIADAGHPRTANMCRTLLYSALKQAVRWDYLTRNVVEAVDPIKQPTKEPQLWTPAQTRAFIDLVSEHRLYAAFYLLITTGLRRGELLGLRWQDIRGDVLRIEQALTLVGNMPVLSTPKTQRGARWVSIAPDVTEVLKRHGERQRAEQEYLGEAWEECGLVFTSEVGTPIHPRNFFRTWTALQKSAGLPKARIHDLRHLHISLLVWRGFDAKTIADRVGHTDPAFTYRRYAHLFEEQRRAAAASMDDLLGSAPGSAGERPD
jgi:integrase